MKMVAFYRWIPLIFALLIPKISTSVLEGKQESEDSSTVLESIFSYLHHNKDSIYSIYEHARLFNDIISISKSPITDNIMKIISPKSSIERSVRGLDSINDYHIPKMINNWMVPQISEKIRVIYAEFKQSTTGKRIMDQVDILKIQKIFSDEKTGKFSYDKFVELMENHSFRKHWIAVVTKRVSGYISFYSDSEARERFVSTTLFTVNDFLLKIGVPTSNLLDLNRPDESISNLINYLFKNYFFYSINSKEYVQPIVIYVRNLFLTARDIVDLEKLENILIDTINMDIIEPTLRVNRAYRFLVEHPYCDRYVMCVVNTEEQDDPKLPGVKRALSKGASLAASWFLAVKTKSSFATLYNDIIGNNYCEKFGASRCRGFHVEELKVKIPYNHKEL